LARAVKLAFGITLKGRLQPSVALGMSREKVKKVTERALRRQINREGRRENRRKRRELKTKDKQGRKFNKAVNRMTNWQRNQWARRDPKPLGRFMK
jgi:hypothetical protein